MKTYNLKITIKSLCLFEKLTDIPFSKFQDKEENILPMLYCVLVSHPENGIHMSYEEALKNLFTERNMIEMAPQLQTQIAFYNQFGNVSGMLRPETIDSSTADTSTGEDDKGMYINDIIPILVSDCGLSIEYVMNELFYTDIEKFMVYRRQKEQARMEDQRFWTWLNISPHIDTKKCKSPEQLLPFPWEKAAKQKKFNSEVEEVSKKLRELGILKDDNKDEKKDAE